MKTLARLALHASLATVLLTVLAVPAAAANMVQGTVGAYRMYDNKSDPSTLCAYPVGGSKLKEFRARGPRVDFPSSVGQVGWVEWRASAQRMTDAGTWKSIGDVKRIRRTVTVGFTKTFPTTSVKVDGPAGQARIRLVSRLDWYDQGDTRVGKVRHVVQNYGWDRFNNDVLDTDMISFDEIVRRSTASCPNRWQS
jgi:hypothetical protein